MQLAAKISSPIRVFLSYAHEDEKLLEKLKKHLRLLERGQVIELWHDRRIAPGVEWKGAIDRHLEEAGIVMLLVSSDFLDSEYCYDLEMRRAMERHEQGFARVVPVILRDVDWQHAPFAKLNALPKNAKPVRSWRDIDEALKTVADGIRVVAEELSERIDDCAQVISSLNAIVSESANASIEDRTGLRRKLDTLASDLTATVWIGKAEIRSLLGDAYVELGDPKQAIAHYSEALVCNEGVVPVSLIDRLGNLQTRYAVFLSRESGSPDRATIQTLLESAIALLQLKCRYRPSLERLALLGSTYKRQAWISSGAARQQAISHMESTFRDARDLGTSSPKQVDLYPTLNWLTASLLQSWRDEQVRSSTVSEVDDWLNKAEAVALEERRSTPGFWSDAAYVDCQLLRHLFKRDLAAHASEITRGYSGAVQRDTDVPNVRTVVELLDFLIEMLEISESHTTKQQLEKSNLDALLTIRTELAEQVRRVGWLASDDKLARGDA